MRAAQPMKAAPAPKASSPARRAPGVSRAPTARPTRTLPALPMPMAKVKVTEEKVRAILVRGEALRPQPPGEEPREREDADLGPEVQADGHAHPEDAALVVGEAAVQIQRPRRDGDLPDDPGEEEHLADLHEAGGQRRAAGTHGRNPPQRPGPGRQPCAAEDQEEIAEQVEHVGQHRGPDQRARRPHRLRVAALRIEGQQRGDAGEPPPDELPRGPRRRPGAMPNGSRR